VPQEHDLQQEQILSQQKFHMQQEQDHHRSNSFLQPIDFNEFNILMIKWNNIPIIINLHVSEF